MLNKQAPRANRVVRSPQAIGQREQRPFQGSWTKDRLEPIDGAIVFRFHGSPEKWVVGYWLARVGISRKETLFNTLGDTFTLLIGCSPFRDSGWQWHAKKLLNQLQADSNHPRCPKASGPMLHLFPIHVW